MLFVYANILIFNEIGKDHSLFWIGIFLYFINVVKGCGLVGECLISTGLSFFFSLIFMRKWRSCFQAPPWSKVFNTGKRVHFIGYGVFLPDNGLCHATTSLACF